ncbi:MAG: hypothetical protein Q8N99_07145 [Nanoarchaeota archaeon]|nr:hypothetical protein [Nanoarchaeota archaeon]
MKKMVKKSNLAVIILFLFIFIYLNFVSASSCWLYTSNATGQCTAANGCRWKTDSWSLTGWCEELNCWSLNSQSECTTTNVPGKNCTWTSGGTSYGCEKLSCWSLSGTNANSCVNSSVGLSCEWQNSCYQSGTGSMNCWQYQNQSSCLNVTGCLWGNCMEKGCWSYNNASICNAAKDWNGRNCTWNSNNIYCEENGCWKYYNQTDCSNTVITKGLRCQWKYNSCQDIDCYTWDFTNTTACINNSLNLSCSWSGSYCMKQDCWSYNTQPTCQNQSGCLWKAYVSSGWCNEVNCWTWDSMNGGNQSRCQNNTYGLSCSWSGNPAGNLTNGWCYKNIASLSCSNFTTERSCMDTYYCWWQYDNFNNLNEGGICSEPGSFGGGGGGFNTNTTILNDWNPGCYIFDMNSTDCNNVIGCNYTGSNCVSVNNSYGGNITLNGLNCSYINNSQLCNSLPALSSCCSWQNGSCIASKLSSSCRDQVTTPPEGADFCEDYNSYSSQALCEQIAGSPWYMPCEWNNASSKCSFKASDVFGNETQSLAKIDNKKNCESAGGKWITENYCEGNISVPAGRCEYKFDEEDNCDKACFACEIKDSNGNSVNATNAASACSGSKLGICDFENNTRAANGIGFCKAKEQFKKGIAGDCDINCGDCVYKGNANNNDTTKRPSYFCSLSKANSDGGGCKWITDNSTATGGYCVNKGEKTCEDSCDRCNSQTNCVNLGRTSISNQTGSCKWQGSETTGSCVANIGQDVEICWDGIDNTDDNLIDCADSSCYADSSCGFVSGDCFGWTANASCVNHDCEWVTDKWGSWCDFKGSQCWKYNQNSSICNNNIHCQWSAGTGTMTGWCEKDWSQQENCMGLSQSSCMAANTSGCNWTLDSWCSGNGNGSEWCSDNGGWCDNILFKPKDCWKYSSLSGCNVVSGCSWRTDQYSMPHCEVNWSANCWQYTSNETCRNNSLTSGNCIWDIPLGGGGGWCMNKADKCWSYSNETCNSALGGICYWQSWESEGATGGGSCQSICWNGSFNTQGACSASYGCAWKSESGWCEESEMAACSNISNMNNQTYCQNTSGCRWKSSGWCDPKSGGFSTASVTAGGGVGSGMGGDCFKYDGNQTLCTNKLIINISCGWSVNPSPSCEVNWGNDCWRYSSPGAGGCNATNGCWFKNDTWGSYCTNIMDQCWNNVSYQMWNNSVGWAGNCSSNYLCINNSWEGCEPRCSLLDLTSCTNATYNGKCRYTTGWCNPSIMNDMFSGMEAGAPAPLGSDSCEEGIQASVDICGFGMKDMGDSYGFGIGVNSFENSSVCNKEKLSSFVMGMVGGGGGAAGMPAGVSGGGYGGQEKTGSGNETVIILVYLDTDGSTLGGCMLDYMQNSTGAGYEFRFKYTSTWNANTSKAIETFNSDECDSSSWKAADIKISAWKKKMCSDIGGPMIAVKKADLGKFPSLYDSTKDIRVAVATIGNFGNISSPTDSAGPGWVTPGSVDFDIQSAFSYGADSSKFEDILKNGFVKGEDCFNNVDDDGEGNTDCDDWDCQYSSKCTGTGVNTAGRADTSAPLVTGVNIEEYTDSVLIMYDTNKPTNGTLEWYGADSQCLNSTSGEPGLYIIPDIGIVKSNTIRQFKTWHVASLYEGAIKMNSSGFFTYNAPLASGVNSYYKIRVCDSSGKCSVSKCSSFKLPTSLQKCAYCNFVTRIKPPTGWKVAYDIDRNGIYEYVQGEVCGPNAGMKTNYTTGRRVNVKLYATDGSTYIEFLNASLTKSGLNDKVRTVSTSGSMINDATKKIVGMNSETRDKIVNNLHPEVCRIKIPVASGATCDRLYHCDDNGENCVDRTSIATLVSSADCLWQVPYCEFSTYKTSGAPGGTTASAGGGGGGGAAGAMIYTITNTQLAVGYAKEIAKNDRIKFTINNETHYTALESFSSTTATINVSSTPQKAILTIGEEKKFELTNDGSYDILIKLNYINMTSKKISLTIKSISEKVITPITENVVEDKTKTESSSPDESPEKGVEENGVNLGPLRWTWVIIAVILVALIFLVIFKVIRKYFRS